MLPEPSAASTCTAQELASGDMAATPGVLKNLEHAVLKQLAGAHQGSRAELARKLGISERSLYRKLKELHF
jgi:DNA-binding NtrC family response regulator